MTTVKGFPFSGTTPNDAGPYTAAEWALIWQAMIGNYERRTTAGVLLGVGNGTDESLLVEETSPQSLGVIVRRGWAQVQGFMCFNDTDTTLSINQNTDPADDRIDTIAMQVDISNSDAELVVKQGTPAASPTPPTLTQTDTIWEIRIADITVTSLDTVIVDADIDNTVREYAIRRVPEEGGTGRMGGYAAGDFLYAATTDPTQLSLANLVGAGHELIHDGSSPVQIDRRPIVAWYEEPDATPGETYTQQTWNTMTLNNLDDPTGYAGLASNQLTLAAGVYELLDCSVRAFSGNANPDLDFRFQDVTNVASLFERGFAFTGAEKPPYSIFVKNLFTIADVADDHELQIYPDGTGGTTWSGVNVTGGNFVEIYHWIAFRRVY